MQPIGRELFTDIPGHVQTVLYTALPTCQARCTHQYNSGTLLWVHPISLHYNIRPTSQKHTYICFSNPEQKPGEVLSLSVEANYYFLLSMICLSNCFLNICVCTHQFLLLLASITRDTLLAGKGDYYWNSQLLTLLKI